MRSPLAPIAAAFAAGISLGWMVHPPAVCLWLAAAPLFFCAIRRRSLHPLFLLILFLIAGALRAETDGRLPRDSVARLISDEERPVLCEGTVSEIGWRQSAGAPARRAGWFTFSRRKEAGGWVPASGRVCLHLPALGAPLAEGDIVRFSGSIRAGRAGMEDSFNEKGWLWVHHAVGVLSVSEPDGMERIGSGSGWIHSLKRRAEGVREFLRERGRAVAGRRESAYLEALLLGQGEWIPKSEWDLFRKTGTVHILVVSGLHVGLISFLILTFLAVVRVPRTPRLLLTSIGLFFYCLVAGAHPSVVRATVAGIVLTVGAALGTGRSSLLNSLGLAALCILWFDPRALADPSFQLSFAAVIGLIACAPRIERIFVVEDPLPGPRRMRFRWIVQPLAASFSAWAATAPIIAWHFGVVTPAALLANLVVVPWALLLIANGFILYGISGFAPAAAVPLAAVFGILLEGLLRFNGWIAQCPAGHWKILVNRD